VPRRPCRNVGASRDDDEEERMSVVSRIPRALTGRVALVAAVAALLAACSSSAGGGPGAASTSTSAPVAQASDKYPNSIVVLGHSGATGYDSDPKAPETDATQNSWATGDNPEIRSISTCACWP
jgi:hypothetical protein